tara:strand:- start:413 stop:1006 length:594 start_codon:yes stop_codon:yes gene_type:complete
MSESTPKAISKADVEKNSNPNTKNLSVAASSTGNWYVHLQTVDLMYIRRNQFDANTSSVTTSPTVTSNYLDVQATVQTQDEIYENVAFSSIGGSGEAFQAHQLQIQNDNASGGFGVTGVVSTSSMGIIRRKAREDARGNFLDPSGICIEHVSMVLDQMPGAYNSNLDTSGTVNGVVAQAMGQLSQACPTFKATLVEL